MDKTGNMKETEKRIEVMKAYLEGKAIQMNGGEGWNDTNYPQWDWGLYDYRVKPEEQEEPKKLMTNRQLSELIQKGYGTWVDQNALSFVHAGYSYALSKENDIVTDKCIRPWGSDKWLEPTVDIYKAFINSKEKERRYQNIKISIKKRNGDDFEVEPEPDEENIKDYSDGYSEEPEVGEVFKIRGRTLKCIEEKDCTRCAFQEGPSSCCPDIACSNTFRKDGKSVVFVDVSKTENTTASEESSSTQGECIGVHKRTPQEIADFFGCYVAYDSSIGSFSTYEKPPVFSGEFCWIVSDRFVATTDSCKEKHIIYRPHLEPIVMEVEDD